MEFVVSRDSEVTIKDWNRLSDGVRDVVKKRIASVSHVRK